jgi:mannose-6-phosphate isomerase
VINITATTQNEIFEELENYLSKQKLTITKIDNKRPWGGFFVIDENDAEKFIETYFPHLTKQQLSIGGKLSPKILVVAPNKRLSWQYHHRRAEIWKLIGGKAKVALSDNDEETEIVELNVGDIVQLSQGKRHRLIGDENNWGIVAEIWQHTNEENPSDEDDIVRLQDDFGR